MWQGRSLILVLMLSLAGCAGFRDLLARQPPTATSTEKPLEVAETQPATELPPTVDDEIVLTAGEERAAAATAQQPQPAPTTLQLDVVVSSVYANFPLLEVARYQRNIANADILAANGNFDTKLKAASENGPVGYYQTYRQMVGVSQPLYGGAEVFGGYRVGRGNFQPWYQERQTNGN